MQLMTITVFSKNYSVSRSTINRLRGRGELPVVYIGRAVRIRLSDAEAWVASLKRPDNDA
jgi:excisionase family DNA binding protein